MMALQPPRYVWRVNHPRRVGMMEKRSAHILNKHPDLLVLDAGLRCAIPQGYDGVLQ
jgi:hypothetical protein